MAEKRTSPETPGARRKRAAPTIDLTATDVTPPAGDPAPAAASAPEPTPEPVAAEPATASMPPPEPPKTEAPPPSGSVPPPRRDYAAALAAGVIGAAVMSALFGALWYAGFFASPAADDSGLRAQIAALQSQVKDLQNKPAPAPAADTKAIDALSKRVAQLQDDIAKLPPGDKTVAERLAAADNAMKALGLALTALSRRTDDSSASAAAASQRADAVEKAVKELQDSVQHAAKEASSAVGADQLDAVQKRLAALEQSVKGARAELTRSVNAGKATRLALSAASLRTIVQSGAPYAAELAQAKALGGDAAVLAPLDAFAASGAPGKATLAQELRALMPTLMQAAGGEAPSSSFLERLQANASKLVRVRPVDAPSGDATADVLARLEVEAARADIGAALADLAKLPETARAPAQAWMAKAKARQAALSAADQFAAATARSLSAP